MNVSDYTPSLVGDSRRDRFANRLRRQTQRDCLGDWCATAGDPSHALDPATWTDWGKIPLNAKGHLPWTKGRQVLWLAQEIVVPDALEAYPLTGLTLRLALTWWAEDAQIFVDGQLVQAGDLFDCSARVVLREQVLPGERIPVALRLVSPGHDDGALVRSHCIYERPQYGLEPCPEPGFVADELDVVQHYVETFAPAQLGDLAAAVAPLDWSQLANRAAFDQALCDLRQRLLPFGEWIRQRQISLLGHAHLDLAWLWPVAETWDAAERTFKSVLSLQAEFPDLIFTHSSPALYAWMETNRPALFEAIRAQVAAGRWEVAAGLWVEPELNLISAESIARQILYGQRYVQETFGRISAIAWLPDTFGFCWQLPQFLRQGGVEFFVTQKLRWNDTNEFPHEAFWWEGPDGSRIFSLHSAPIGEGFDPLKMARYATQFEQKTGYPHALWLIGVGDHGGGPTRDMLHLAQRWGRSPFFPRLQFSTAQSYLEALREWDDPSVNVNPPTPQPPCWQTDLYLEFHRGCYTTHADQKRWNRCCEALLSEAELWSAMTTLALGLPYPATALETAWKKVLFNQFHDILPGSAIPDVYAEANREWAAAAECAKDAIDAALGAIARYIALPPAPHSQARAVLVFNPLNWSRSAVVRVGGEERRTKNEKRKMEGQEHRKSKIENRKLNWEVRGLDGRAIAAQWVLEADDDEHWEIAFRAEAVSALGYACFWLCPVEGDSLAAEPLQPTASFVLENEFLRVAVDPATGNLASVFDKAQQREVLAGPGNQLQAFQDGGQYWDAWNIDPAYESYPLPPPQLEAIRWVNNGAIAQTVEIVRSLGRSTFRQRYELQTGSPLLQIRTWVDWQERHVLVKAAFPLNLTADFLTCEIPGGVIQRPTQPKNSVEAAQWEVPALRWADLTSSDASEAVPYGVSLLNDSKHGYDSRPSQIRLTLLRGAAWPNPAADLGHHEFTYALYPHAGCWQAAETVQHGYEQNQPLRVRVVDPATATPSQAALPPVGSLLHLDAGSAVVSALKPAEDGSGDWIMRCYESQGASGEIRFLGGGSPGGGSPEQRAIAQVVRAVPTNLLENANLLADANAVENERGAIALQPWQVLTLRLTLQPAPKP
ncbi:alpha-mannosidase [Thermoleptolyngbya sichuanensis A183]|uniref:Alpha-mannosidase n=1 Tax=Thermoleptolyngbya sichuanensis A183 TaxID=2737172 RepID=A0A6M8BG01_9CYAN|nr:alpha-mannosidase [Thermoleptolyngbya sichuanensis]QKD81525.1 alpha-mannosidase [Thermoleptolyngbya sichuanensis A183]